MRGVICLLLLTLSLAAQAEGIGKVIAARGDTHALNDEGVQRTLKRRSAVFNGDTLVTGADARLQVRFADGTLLALRPESEYRVDSYQYDQAEDDENFSTLLKGGFRTITGVISKDDPEAYKVKTPVATIGVRGTNYETALVGGGLDVAAWEGGVELESETGKLVIGLGQDFNYARVAAPNARPTGLLQPPPSMSGPMLDEGTADVAPSAENQADDEATTEPTTETQTTADAGEGDALLAEPEAGDSLLLSSTELDTTLTSGPTTDTTFTPVEPPTEITDLVDDRRFDPAEWDRLFAEGYGGIFVFGGTSSDSINGGRALAPEGTSDPVLTHTHVEPSSDDFSGITIDTVYRRGMADLDGMGTVTVGSEQVYWGIWNGTTTPVDKLTNPDDGNDVQAVYEPVFWVLARPQDPARTDIGVYNFVDTFHGGGSLGLLSPGDVTQFSMNINFATGAVSSGVLDIVKSPDSWNVLFDGDIRGPFVYLNVKNGSLINSLHPIQGDMGGFMTGSGGKALVGAFDLRQATDSSNHIEGIFILRE